MIVSLRLGLLLDIVNWCVLPYYLMYHCNYEHTGLKCKVLPFTALLHLFLHCIIPLHSARIEFRLVVSV